MLFYAARRLPQPVWDASDELAVRDLRRAHPLDHRPRRDRNRALAMLHQLATPRAPAASACRWPGVGGEARARRATSWRCASAARTSRPGYWRQPELTRAASTRRASTAAATPCASSIRPIRSKGLAFDGRIAEDFKLDTGTWVSVGPLRAQIIAAGAPYVQDVVITGHDRRRIGALVFPQHRALCRTCQRRHELARRDAAASAARRARRAKHRQLDPHRARDPAHEVPPSIDAGEITDKGSINQRAVLKARAASGRTALRGTPAPQVLDAAQDMNHEIDELVAIDVHTHAWKSTRCCAGRGREGVAGGAGRYFRYAAAAPDRSRRWPRTTASGRWPSSSSPWTTRGAWASRKITNEEVAELAHQHSDVAIPFASIDPARGKMGVREARRLIKDFGVKGFKFHPSVQGFCPNDRMAYPLYEAIAEAKLPALFHTGQTGIGAGMPGGGGIRLKYSNPMLLDDVAADFPDMPIILAHPVVPLAGGGAVGGDAQAEGLHRPLGLVAEVLPADPGAVREHAAQGQDPVRLGLPGARRRSAGWPNSRSCRSSPRCGR